MDNKETLKILHDFQCWRRGRNMDMPDPTMIGNAIDNAIRLLRKEKKINYDINMDKKLKKYLEEFRKNQPNVILEIRRSMEF